MFLKYFFNKITVFLLPVSIVSGLLLFVFVGADYLKTVKNSIRNKKQETVLTSNLSNHAKTTNNLLLTKMTQLPFSVLINAAHGGSDTGYTGGNLIEKNVTLDFSLLLARSLRMKGINAYLIRNSDNNYSDQDRFESALEYKNINLFVTIECNQSDLKMLHGLEIIGDSKNNNHADIMFEKKTEYEDRIASYIVKQTGINLSAYNKEPGATIYAETEVPSLTILLGYLTNDEDVKKLRNKKYVEYLSDSIATGIYFGLTKIVPAITKTKKIVSGNETMSYKGKN